ncbi:MAG TPA: 2-oxo acid dehydrogenase subunit E2, partial [Rhodanobacteraceae bacterium]|nr:2-oxo acid dehydrogenase subunit E2 [Rhodanobacteraceae bacterium]
MSIEVKVPVLPESVSDATIATWHKKPGDAVKRDENLVDLETDKVVLEVPAPADGVLKEIRHDTGDTVNSQDVIGILEEGAVAEAPKPAAAKQETRQPAAPAKAEPAKPAPSAASANEGLSPAGRRVATEENIDASQVSGTGRGGRVTKEDLVNFSKGGSPVAAQAPATRPATPGARPEERVPMTRMRARIAERLMQSKNSIAMLTSFNEVNLSKVVAMRKQVGEQFEKTHGIKLGFMSFFVKAACEALKRHPVVNASVDGNDIIYHGYQDISIAVSTDRGLVTPVL